MTANTVVFTAWRDSAGLSDNLHAMAELAHRLDRLGAVWYLAVGYYEGAIEQSVVVEGLTEHGVHHAMVIAKDYHQAAILVIDHENKAVLRDCASGDVNSFGYWREVSQALAVTRIGWTTHSGRWFIVDETPEGN